MIQRKTFREQTEKIYQRHKEWMNVAYFFGLNSVDAEDVVYEMYCKMLALGEKEGNLDRLFTDKGNVNEVYIFQSIKNGAINVKKLRGRMVGMEECGELVADDSWEVMERKRITEERLERIRVASMGLSWFDRRLFEIYFSTGKSLRVLAKETHISFYTIAYHVKKTKNYIKTKVGKE